MIEGVVDVFEGLIASDPTAVKCNLVIKRL